MNPSDLPSRIAAHIQVDEETGCWLWTRKLGRQGYGRMWWDGRGWPIHRLTYRLLVRPLSEWEIADHLCCVRLCCNPAHIEPVSAAENSRRGNRARRADACQRGHPYTPENTYTYQYATRVLRQCRECVKLRQHTPEFRQRQRELENTPERRVRKAEYWQTYAERRRAAPPPPEQASLF